MTRRVYCNLTPHLLSSSCPSDMRHSFIAPSTPPATAMLPLLAMQVITAVAWQAVQGRSDGWVHRRQRSGQRHQVVPRERQRII